MIKSFKHKGLKEYFQTGSVSGIQAKHQRKLRMQLAAIDTAQEIDDINILNASFLAMHRAIDQLKIKPELLLIDGNRYTPHCSLPYQCIIKGDSKFFSIAAASVLAKTYRDKLMQDLAKEYPLYSWETNVGYPTTAHRQGIRKQGITSYHRKTFQLLPK